jgi:hypothetical protein
MIYGMLFISVNLHRAAGTQNELRLDDGHVESTAAAGWRHHSTASADQESESRHCYS